MHVETYLNKLQNGQYIVGGHATTQLHNISKLASHNLNCSSERLKRQINQTNTGLIKQAFCICFDGLSELSSF